MLTHDGGLSGVVDMVMSLLESPRNQHRVNFECGFSEASRIGARHKCAANRVPRNQFFREALTSIVNA
jgi:hypothetical protein